jgi:uncharacterized protein (TIGR00251 family)
MAATISVRVKPNARANEVRETAPGEYAVSVSVPPADGKANERVVELLAKHFRVPKRDVVLVRGAGSRQKVFSIG